MLTSTVVIEDKFGQEHIGEVTTSTELHIDQNITVQIFNGRYVNGFILEIREVTHHDKHSTSL